MNPRNNIHKLTPKELLVKKIKKVNERERSMFDEAINLGVRDISYYLPNKQQDEGKVENG